MKTLILIETVEELFDFIENRYKDTGEPKLPEEAKIVFEDNMNYVQLQRADGFILSNDIKTESIIIESFKRNKLNISLT